MPALDFPASPTNGQVYGQYTYDATKGAWRVIGVSGTSVISSATPPSSPTAGNIWFNTNDGVFFVYYNDGDTSQWVEMKANTASGSTVAARVDALEAADAGTNKSGLVPILPTSVSVGSGSASVNSNGTIFFTNAEYMQLNGVFTTAYDFYKLVYTHNGKSSNSSLRWTTGGTPNATSGQYYSAIYVFRSAGTSAVYGNVGGASITDLSYGSDSNSSTLSADISGPANSSFRTQMQWQQNGAGLEGRVGAAEYSNPATIFDGFRIYALNGAGTYTATMNVYGYRR